MAGAISAQPLAYRHVRIADCYPETTLSATVCLSIRVAQVMTPMVKVATLMKVAIQKATTTIILVMTTIRMNNIKEICE